MSLWPKVREELNTMVNRHFETAEYLQLFGVKLTPARLLGRCGGACAARREARDLGTRKR